MMEEINFPKNCLYIANICTDLTEVVPDDQNLLARDNFPNEE